MRFIHRIFCFYLHIKFGIQEEVAWEREKSCFQAQLEILFGKFTATSKLDYVDRVCLPLENLEIVEFQDFSS